MQPTPHTQSQHTHAPHHAYAAGRVCLARALTLALVLALTSCAAPRSVQQGPPIPPPPRDNRLARAIELTAQGERAQNAGDSAAAMDLYKEATTLSADAPSAAWNNLGMLHMERGHYREAAGHLSTAAQLAPFDPQPMYNLGLTYHNAGWDRRALEAFLGALDREPNYAPAIRGAATATMRLRITDEDALDRLRHALLIETDPTWRSVFQREYLAMEARLDLEDR